MDAVIVTPAKPGSRHGNRNTALRWAAHLRALGHRVSVEVEWDGRAHDVMIALHARRSHGAMAAWKKAFPARPLVCVLTGTDLYRDIRDDAGAKRSLELADRLVVLQEKGLDELEPRHRAKAAVIFQSVRRRARRPAPRSHFLVTVIGHLRDEKDPFCAARALADVPGEVRVVHLGGALSADMGREAKALMREQPRYRWLGELPHAKAMHWLSRSHCMVISSRMEGGAHVVSEAIAFGVPVLASHIPGNVGLLGEAYPGYYPLENHHALAALIERARSDRAFRRRLEAGVRARRALVRPPLERRTLGKLLAGLTKRGAARTG